MICFLVTWFMVPRCQAKHSLQDSLAKRLESKQKLMVGPRMREERERERSIAYIFGEYPIYKSQFPNKFLSCLMLGWSLRCAASIGDTSKSLPEIWDPVCPRTGGTWWKWFHLWSLLFHCPRFGNPIGNPLHPIQSFQIQRGGEHQPAFARRTYSFGQTSEAQASWTRGVSTDPAEATAWLDGLQECSCSCPRPGLRSEWMPQMGWWYYMMVVYWHGYMIDILMRCDTMRWWWS